MKKILLIITLGLFLGATGVSAANYTFRNSSGAYSLGLASGYNVNTETQPESYIGMILNILFSIVGLIFLGLAISAGFKWMNARGDATEVKAAKDTLKNAIIGLAVVLLAYAITLFVFGFFQNGKNLKSTTATSTSSCLLEA